MMATVRAERSFTHWWLLPLAMATLMVSVASARYSRSWAEVDTVVLTNAARGILNQGTIAPSGLAYTYGFSYPTLTATLASVTGLSVTTVQTIVLPYLLLATAIIAFVAFRRVTGSGALGAVCAVLLLVQPDFFFVTQRGSHEKLTWTLVLVLLFTLVAGLRQFSIGQAAPFVVAFYVAGFALLCSNAFFASSFVTTTLIALIGAAIIARWWLKGAAQRRLLRRLASIFVTLVALSYLVIVYVYPLAQDTLTSAERAFDRIALVYLNVEEEPTAAQGAETGETGSQGEAAAQAPATREIPKANPYATVSWIWTSREVYLLLTAFTWLLLLAAGLSWVIFGIRFLRRRVSREELPLFVIWMFAAASALQILASMGSDYAGVLGSNLQLRLFPPFTLYAIPLVVLGLVAASRIRLPVAVRRVATVFSVVVFCWFTLAATLKVTNDPLISNLWTFYTDAEARMIQWGDRHLSAASVWSEFDTRIDLAATLTQGDRPVAQEGARWTWGSLTDSTRYVVVSDVTRARATRVGRPLPATEHEDRIYDNGRVQVNHRIPATPFQP